MSDKNYVGIAPLTMIRTQAGGYLNVYAGGPVPDDITDEDLKRLVDEGFLGEAEAEAEEDVKSDKVKDILADVGDDKEKAAAALEVEKAKAEPRKTLVEPLEALLAKND